MTHAITVVEAVAAAMLVQGVFVAVVLGAVEVREARKRRAKKKDSRG